MRGQTWVLMTLLVGCADAADSKDGVRVPVPVEAGEQGLDGDGSVETPELGGGEGPFWPGDLELPDGSAALPGGGLDGSALPDVEPEPTGFTLIDSVSAMEATCAETGGVLPGDLWIVCPDCTDLEKLSCLTEVNGSLRVLGNPALRSLAGLEQVVELGRMGSRDIVIRDNPLLEDVSALQLDLEVGPEARIEVVNNPALTALDWELATRSARMVWLGALVVEHNPLLADLSGLHLGVPVAVDTFVLRGNDRVRSLGASSIIPTGSLTVEDNAMLESLDGLGPVALRGALTISDNAELIELDALEGLRRVGGALRIEGNRQLESVHGLRQLEQVGHRLTGVPTTFAIVDNDSLDWIELGPDFVGLSLRPALGGRAASGDVLRIEGNDALEGISGFDGLRGLYGLELIDNPQLRSIEAFDGVERLVELVVTGNAALSADRAQELADQTQAQDSVLKDNAPVDEGDPSVP